MRILGIDSSSLTASVALVDEEVTIAEYTVNYKKTHSQTLLPMLDEIVQMTEQDLTLIDAIAIAAGPGSFTGLRIGSATAKGLGMALHKPIISVPTVEGIAANLYGTDKLICPLMDARRSQTYTGLYEFKREEGTYRMHYVRQQCAVDIMDIIKEVNEKEREVIFLGDGTGVFKTAIQENVTVPYSFAPSTCNRQRAAVVAWLGMQYFTQYLQKQEAVTENLHLQSAGEDEKTSEVTVTGRVQSAASFAPEYLRLSQAERERMEKNSK